MSTIEKKDFINAWKIISNDQRRYPKIVEKIVYGQKIKEREKGWIYPSHHIIYNYIRGLPLERGFYKEGEEKTEGYKYAISNLDNKWMFDKLYKPFIGFFEIEDFKFLLKKIYLEIEK